jgi:hypothetical protein
MQIWIGSAILVAIGYLIFCKVKKVLDKRFALKAPIATTPLPEFRESHATDSRFIAKAISTIENISERFERMCVLDHFAYKDDPSIPTVIDQYRKLLRGEIKDPEGRHMPSEILNGNRNPDYDKYIAAQKSVMGKTGCRESIRLKRINQEDELRVSFVTKLLEMKFPEAVLGAVLSDNKLNSYTADDWKRLTKTVKGYLEIYPAEIVAQFLSYFDELSILCDSNKIETFSIFYKYDAPMPIVSEIIRERITVDQGLRITKLVINEKYDWDEAMEEVLEEDTQKATEEDLRKQYRQMLRK